jgi:hypothetical protein
MKPQQLIFQVSLFASCALFAQELEPLEEDFLLFLAEGMEVDGDWKDPMSLANLSELDEMPSDEIAWVAEQDQSALEEITQDVDSGSSNDGDEYE